MRFKKFLSFLGVISIIFIVGIFTLILFPQPLFSNSYEYKNFKIYSNYELNQEAFNDAIDKAIVIVNKSEINDPNYNYDVFLASETSYNQIDNFILGEWPVARAIDNNVIIKREVNEEERSVKNGENEFDLVYVLVHEIIHCLQSEKYGKLKFNPVNHPPYWKLEGYPEYIARRELLESKEYDLRIGISDFLNRTESDGDLNQIIQISEKESTPYIYYKGRLMVEYLMDIKKMSYDQILDNSVQEDSVYSEMMKWYEEQ